MNNVGNNTKHALLIQPLSFLRSGSYGTDGNIGGRGSSGYAWSSKSSSGTDAYYLSFSSSRLYYQYSDYRGDGRPVRCVAR